MVSDKRSHQVLTRSGTFQQAHGWLLQLQMMSDADFIRFTLLTYSKRQL